MSDPNNPYEPPNQPPYYGYPGGPYGGYPGAGGTNGLAIASLVLGIVTLCGVGSVLAVIFGHIALNQIRERNESGRGLAIAGLVLGYVGVGLIVIYLVMAASFFSLGSR